MAKRKWTRQETDAWLDSHDSWFYANREDANLFVRKRCLGVNWAFNWGNPWSWVVTVGMAVLLVSVAVLGG